MSRTPCLVLSVVAAALLSACAAEPPPQAKSTVSVSEPGSWAQDTTTQRPSRGSELGAPTPVSRTDSDSSSLVIEERITSACGISPTAHFAFDSYDVEGTSALDSLATCFVSGPLAGRKLRIVGHTDPRGEPYHNLVLGQRRATGVAFYLNAHGFDLLNVHTMTMGSKEAVGTDEEGWAKDRRVELFLEDE